MKKSRTIAISVLLAIAIVLSIVAGVMLYRENRLNSLQRTALSELEENAGEYDEQKIVLYDTTASEAAYMELSESERASAVFTPYLSLCENSVYEEDDIPYTYITLDDGTVEICSYTGSSTYITIPNTIEGKVVSSIGEGAFSDEINLIQVHLPSGLTNIGKNAFYNCRNLLEIEIPEGVAVICDYAFAECDSLTTVIFDEYCKLSYVNQYAFYGCISLVDILLPESVVEIGQYAFYSCSSLTDSPLSSDSELKIIHEYAFSYTGIINLVLPDAVININDYAFRGAKLKSVYIADANVSTLVIGLGAFADCEELAEITVPFIGASFEDDEITWFGYIFGAGSYKENSTFVPESLKIVTITGDITFVGTGAFYLLESLEYINVPHSVTTLYEHAFYATTAIYELTNTISTTDNLASIANAYRTGAFGTGISGSLTLAEGITDVYLGYCAYLEEIFIPATVTSLWSSAFDGCISLKNVTFEEGSQLKEIGLNAFFDCCNLTDIEIPSGLESIGDAAFLGCSKLYLVINHSNFLLNIRSTNCGYIAYYARLLIDKNGNKTYIEEGSDVIYIDTSDGFSFMYEDGSYKLIAYLGTEDTVTLPESINGSLYTVYCLLGVKNVIIPDTFTKIDDDAFHFCTTLESIVIPDSVTYIGDFAFTLCSRLTGIKIPSGVNYIGQDAFNGCSSITSIEIPDDVTVIQSYTFYNCNSLSRVTIGKNSQLTSIGSVSFAGCCNLTNIFIPKYVNLIEASAFNDTGVKKIIVSEDNVYFSSSNGILYDKEKTQIVFVLDTVASVIIPNTVTNISSAFYNCSNIVSVTFEEGSAITTIGAFAFYGCSSLTEIVIPDSVTCIEYSAFFDCSSLTSLVIPSRVTSIGNSYTFSYCSSLTNIVFENDSQVTSIGNSLFEGCDSLISIVIPNGVTSIGSQAFYNCSNLKSVMFEENSCLETIGNSAFAGCISLISIEIPYAVTTIDVHAFNGCSSLSSVVMHSSLTSIGGSAFRGCSSLISIELPDEITCLETNTFCDCSSLVSVTFGENSQLSCIDESVFCNCGNLTDIEIPVGVTSIGSYAFYQCIYLTSIEIPANVTSIDTSAFYGCSSLYFVVNHSDLKLTIGSLDNGRVAYFAKLLIDKDGNKTYLDEESGFEFIDTSDGFRFIYDSGTYTLISYLGDEDTVIFPEDINGNAYTIYHMRGVKNIIIPATFTTVDDYAFFGCATLESIILHDGISDIGEYAFYGCSSLKSIDIPKNLTSINKYVFYECSSLTSIEIPDSVTSIGTCAFAYCYSLANITLPEDITKIGDVAFVETAFYNDKDNWTDGCLYIGNYLIRVDTSAKFAGREGVTCIAKGAFAECYYLTQVTLCNNLSGDSLYFLSYLETLIITAMPNPVYSYFGTVSYIPESLQTIVIKKTANVKSTKVFSNITGVTIYVEASEDEVSWDTYYEGWNNGNTVIYGGNYITVEYYDSDGALISNLIYQTSQLILRPYVCDYVSDAYKYTFIGWDTDGDGNIDFIPTTSASNITATALYSVELRCVTEGHNPGDSEKITEATCTTDGVKTYTCEYCGETYTEVIPATGHYYIAQVTSATCTEQGYTTYTCSYCGDTYVADYVDASGHTSGETVIENYVAATCTSNGSYDLVVYCSACGEELSRTSVEMPATGHDYVATVTSATCTEQGYTTYTCSYCDDTYVADYVDATGHTSGETVIENYVAATCTSNGSYDLVVYCSVCGEELSRTTEVIPATGHDYIISDTVDSTCTEQGYTVYTCQYCGDTYKSDYAEALGHSWNSGEITTAATCTTDGVLTYTCEHCGETHTELIAATGHTASDWIVDSEAGVGVEGHRHIECTECGEILYEETIAALPGDSGTTDSSTTDSSSVDSNMTDSSSVDSSTADSGGDDSDADSGSGTQSGSSSGDNKKKGGGCGAVIDSDGGGSGDLMIIAVSMVALCAVYALIRRYKKKG